MTTTQLSETSEELLNALAATIGNTFSREPLFVEALDTGSGGMVATVDLSIDGRFEGRQLRLTRDGETTWLLGFYDRYMDEADGGVCVTLNTPEPDNALRIAAEVAGILERLGVTKLQGE